MFALARSGDGPTMRFGPATGPNRSSQTTIPNKGPA
jgi:hypothetical protein